MNKKFVVRLSDEERGVCQEIIKKLKGSSEKVFGKRPLAHDWAIEVAQLLDTRYVDCSKVTLTPSLSSQEASVGGSPPIFPGRGQVVVRSR